LEGDRAVFGMAVQVDVGIHFQYVLACYILALNLEEKCSHDASINIALTRHKADPN